MIRVEHHLNGPRVYVLGMRLHHGMTGCVLAAAGALSRRHVIAIAGIALIADDLHDFPWSPHERRLTPSAA